MRQRAFVLVAVFAGIGGAVVLPAQVTTKFKAIVDGGSAERTFTVVTLKVTGTMERVR